MLIKCLSGLVAGAALVLLGGCATPCGAPGGLCAPIESNTSTAPAAPPVAAPAPPQAQVQTMPVERPDQAAPAPRLRIGLILPLRSDILGPPAAALRAGFMAAHERDRDGIVVNLIESGEHGADTLQAYQDALASNDLVVGPLARSAVTAVALSGAVSKPTIALNFPEARAGAETAIPRNMLVMGLSIEDEARQVADWAAAEFPAASALIVSGDSAWQRRIASAIAAHWKQLGNASQLVELQASNGYLSEAAINQLRNRLDSDPPALLFTALAADQLRQLKGSLGIDLPMFGTSSVNPGIGNTPEVADLAGVRLLDLPWNIDPAHPAVMVYPRYMAPNRTLDQERLYALGIDAYRVAREIGLYPGKTEFTMDGVTGRLKVSFGNGTPRFSRVHASAVVQEGRFKLLPARP